MIYKINALFYLFKHLRQICFALSIFLGRILVHRILELTL